MKWLMESTEDIFLIIMQEKGFHCGLACLIQAILDCNDIFEIYNLGNIKNQDEYYYYLSLFVKRT